MVQVMASTGRWVNASLFFIILIIIGNYMLLNLFLAILLKFISENEEVDENAGEESTRDISKQTLEDKAGSRNQTPNVETP